MFVCTVQYSCTAFQRAHVADVSYEFGYVSLLFIVPVSHLYHAHVTDVG